MTSPRRYALYALWLAGFSLPALHAANVTIAAAANLVYILESLKTEFKAAHPDIILETVTGASGNLFAQTKGGAPFDVFLSADVEYPRKLIEAGLADSQTLTIFARGRLVFWSSHPLGKIPDLAATLRDPQMKKIALANPQTAPYGRAAQQVLERLGEWKPDSGRWVYGENISQTAQFIESGNADGGFIALSLVLSPRLKGKAAYIEIPESWHEPLHHAGVITEHGKDNAEARLFLSFLREPAARRVFVSFGYAVPE